MKKLLFVLLLGVMGSAYGQNKVAVVSSQEVLDTMASFQQALVAYKERESRIVTELAGLEKEIQVLYNDIVANGPNKPAMVLDQDKKDLERKQGEYQQKEYYLQMELQDYGQKLQMASFENLKEAVTQVCKEMKFDYAMDKTNLIYFNESFDITEKVKEAVWKLEAAKEIKFPEVKLTTSPGNTLGNPGGQN